jgi:hypothetical protein
MSQTRRLLRYRIPGSGMRGWLADEDEMPLLCGDGFARGQWLESRGIPGQVQLVGVFRLHPPGRFDRGRIN